MHISSDFSETDTFRLMFATSKDFQTRLDTQNTLFQVTKSLANSDGNCLIPVDAL